MSNIPLRRPALMEWCQNSGALRLIDELIAYLFSIQPENVPKSIIEFALNVMCKDPLDLADQTLEFALRALEEARQVNTPNLPLVETICGKAQEIHSQSEEWFLEHLHSTTSKIWKKCGPEIAKQCPDIDEYTNQLGEISKGGCILTDDLKNEAKIFAEYFNDEENFGVMILDPLSASLLYANDLQLKLLGMPSFKDFQDHVQTRWSTQAKARNLEILRVIHGGTAVESRVAKFVHGRASGVTWVAMPIVLKDRPLGIWIYYGHTALMFSPKLSLLQVAFDNSSAVVTVYSEDLQPMFGNKGALRFLTPKILGHFLNTAQLHSIHLPVLEKRRPSAIRGRHTPPDFLPHVKDRIAVNDFLTRLQSTGTAAHTMEILTKDGTTCYHHITARKARAPSQGGGVENLVVVAEVDVTKQIQLERQYSQALANLIEEHQALLLERQKVYSLMLQLFPKIIVDRISDGQLTVADQFNDVSILFADIVGFTPWAAKTSVNVVVAELDRLFSQVDELAVAHGVEKIKTVGDCWFGAVGCPVPKPTHAEAIVWFGLALLHVSRKVGFGRRGGDGTALDLRVGIHSGEVIAGVITKTRTLFDLYGDSVNTAARMESTCVPGHLQISQATYNLTKHLPLVFKPRNIDVKGKGLMTTYLVSEETESAPGPYLEVGVSNTYIEGFAHFV